MKKVNSLVIVVLIIFSAAAVQARSIVAQSRITAVTVFNDRAMVKRTAAVKLTKGANIVTFEGLPLHIVEETLRAEGEGIAAARISGLAVRNVFLESSSQSAVRALEGEILSLERALQKIDARRLSLVAQRAFIDSIRVGWGERISKELSLGKPTSVELLEANRFIGDSIFKIEESSFDALAESKPISDKIAALKKQLADMQGDRRREVRHVDLNLDAPAAMELTVELSYLVMQASWEPLYDIRLAPDGKSAELSYRAVVSQNSGEDWQGVNLSLSTATPSMGSSPPELSPWNISFRESPRPMERVGRAMKKSAAAPAPMLMAVPADQPQYTESSAAVEFLQATQQTSDVREGLNSVLFDVPQPVDIPADGSRQSSLIAVETLPVKAEFVTVPKLSPAVFLKSEVNNMTSYPLLAGSVNVFNDSAFVGKSYLKAVAPGQKFDLSFGSDDAIKVKRKVMKVRKDAGMLTGNTVSWRCSVDLENFRKEEISLVLYDQVPIAGNEEIKVAIKDVQPETYEILPEGKVVWKLTLKPGEKRQVTYLIDVEYPKGREVVGTE